jgi:hypothetical protein
MTFENGAIRPFTRSELRRLLRNHEAMAQLKRVVGSIHLVHHLQSRRN